MKKETQLFLGLGIVISALLLAILGVQFCDTFLSSDVPFKAGDEIMYMFSSESKWGAWVQNQGGILIRPAFPNLFTTP